MVLSTIFEYMVNMVNINSVTIFLTLWNLIQKICNIDNNKQCELNCNIKINGTNLSQVSELKYLDTLITGDVR